MDHDNRSLEKTAGCVLIGCAVISLAALSMDPMASGADTRELFKQMVAIGPVHGAIHALQMACLTGYAFAFTVLASRLDLKRAPVLAGLVAFLLGIATMLIATVNDGFLTIAVAQRFVDAAAEDLEIARNIVRFSNMAVVYFGDLAFSLMGAGSALLSMALAQRGVLGRVTAGVGIAGGLGSIGVIAWQPTLDMTALLGIVSFEFSFNLLVGALLLRGAAQPSGAKGAVFA